MVTRWKPGRAGVGGRDGVRADGGQVGQQAGEAVYRQLVMGVLGGGFGQGLRGAGGWGDRAGPGGWLATAMTPQQAADRATRLSADRRRRGGEPRTSARSWSGYPRRTPSWRWSVLKRSVALWSYPDTGIRPEGDTAGDLDGRLDVDGHRYDDQSGERRAVAMTGHGDGDGSGCPATELLCAEKSGLAVIRVSWWSRRCRSFRLR